MYAIRSATIEDSSAIFPLARELATSYTVSEEGFALTFPLILSSQKMCLAVATHSNAVVGYVLGDIHPCFYASGNVAWIEEIMVHKDFRKNGVGKLLMDYFEDWAAKSNCRLVALATRRASKFYEALDYKQSATYFKKELSRP